MLTGMLRKFRMPIYFDFNVTMRWDLMTKIIKAVEEQGCFVRGVVMDLGNKGFLK